MLAYHENSDYPSLFFHACIQNRLLLKSKIFKKVQNILLTSFLSFLHSLTQPIFNIFSHLEIFDVVYRAFDRFENIFGWLFK